MLKKCGLSQVISPSLGLLMFSVQGRAFPSYQPKIGLSHVFSIVWMGWGVGSSFLGEVKGFWDMNSNLFFVIQGVSKLLASGT